MASYDMSNGWASFVALEQRVTLSERFQGPPWPGREGSSGVIRRMTARGDLLTSFTVAYDDGTETTYEGCLIAFFRPPTDHPWWAQFRRT